MPVRSEPMPEKSPSEQNDQQKCHKPPDPSDAAWAQPIGSVGGTELTFDEVVVVEVLVRQIEPLGVSFF